MQPVLKIFGKQIYWMLSGGTFVHLLCATAAYPQLSAGLETRRPALQISQSEPSKTAPVRRGAYSDNGWTAPLSSDRKVVMPTGDVVEPGGIISFREGFKAQIIYEDGQVIGYQLFALDGSKLAPGEAFVFSDGTRLEQPLLKNR